ncbi:hypothetical protein BDV93DRAFT_459390, partial [Ceratobasidium sp. AG-I]
ITEILSRAGVPMLADIIVHYNALDAKYAEMCSNEALPLYHRHAANRGRVLFNKYYQKTDDSEMYRLAILMHPSMRKMYLTHSGWEPDWVDTAIEIAERCWRNHYQPAASAEPVTPATSQFAYSKMYVSIGAAKVAMVCPVCNFVEGKLLGANGEPIMYDPLAWWYRQRSSGHECDGMTQMAIDPQASSVDVERAFSFAGSIVSKRRHNLAPYTVQVTALLGAYSQAGLVRPGILELPGKGPAKAKGKGRGKAKPKE